MIRAAIYAKEKARADAAEARAEAAEARAEAAEAELSAMDSPDGVQAATGIGNSERDGYPVQTIQTEKDATGVAPMVPSSSDMTSVLAINVYYRCGGNTRDTLVDG